jgi:hypothetical protein
MKQLNKPCESECGSKSLANSINLKITDPIVIYEDNNGCISIANNPLVIRSQSILTSNTIFQWNKLKCKKNVVKLNYFPTGCYVDEAVTCNHFSKDEK